MKGKYVEVEVGKHYDLWGIHGVIPVRVAKVINENEVEVVCEREDEHKDDDNYPWMRMRRWVCNLHPYTHHEKNWWEK